MGRHFFEAITDVSSDAADAESREEQNGTSHFLIGAAFLKACRRKGRRKISFVTLSLPEDR